MPSLSSATWLIAVTAIGVLGVFAVDVRAAAPDHQKPESATAVLSLSEGTNLAVAVNPVNGDKVIALQATLYLQRRGDSHTTKLTQWYDDAWEPDFDSAGRRLVYEGYREGSFDLWTINPYEASGPARLTSSPFDDREPEFSPDGASIIFSSDRSGSYDIWQLSLGSEMPERLTFLDGEAHSPTWHPTGDGFAYLVSDRDGSSIYWQPAEAADAQLLLQSASQFSGLQFLPDGERLSLRTLDRDSDGNALSSLSLLDIQTKTLRALTPADADVFPFRAQWQDDGSAVFAADGLIQRWHPSGLIEPEPFVVEVPVRRPEYARTRRDFDSRTPRPVLGLSYPALSPDGAVIAFTALGDLYLWDIDREQLSQVTDDPAADQTPHWARDGRRLAWISDRDGQYKVWTLDLETGARNALAFEQKFISFPAWSPDGSKLAFFTDVPGNPLLHVLGQLVVVDLDTGKQTPILAPMPPQPVNWSADGHYLLTTRLRPYSRRFREGLYVLLAARVETGEAHEIVPVAHRSITHATLADNNRVAYSQNGELNLLQLDADMQPAGKPEVVVASLADMPSFSYSGEHLVYLAGRRLYRLDLRTREARDVTPRMQWQPDLPTEKYVLRAGRLFDATSRRATRDVDILISGHRIEAIGPMDRNTTLPVIDASDKFVIPGLFESHAHIGDHNHSEVQGRTWLAYGITSVRDPGSNPYLANERREAWGSARRIGPRTFVTGHNMDGNRVYYAVAEGIASDAHLERALQRSRELNVDFIKTYVRMPDRQQRRVVEFAHDMGIPVTSHELLPAAAYGVDYVEHFTGTSRRGYATKISELGRSYQDVVEVLAQTGMGVVPTMVVPGVVLTFSEQNDLYSTPQFNAFYGPPAKKNYQDFMGFFGPGSEAYVDAYGDLLSRLVERKALVGVGTDSPFTPFGTGLHAELRLYQREGLAPHEILQAATLQSARIAGVDADLGSIEVGKLADMVILDGDPLADIANAGRVLGTIKNGRYYPLEVLLPGGGSALPGRASVDSFGQKISH
ncbi:MAG: amidohydrolase family protein [Halieaceae bacterium]|jgi:Tol biopolymer transport system component/imidazolonepropionase-like amidohydrolase|nr:amidohydrolase family protein [Halieaceae bacterium]